VVDIIIIIISIIISIHTRAASLSSSAFLKRSARQESSIMDSVRLLRDLIGVILEELGGIITVASILDRVDRALLPYRTGSHWYALRVRHVYYDRFLLAVGSSMTDLQPCRVEDVVACPAGQLPSVAFGSAEACRNPAGGVPTAVSLFLDDVAHAVQDVHWNQDQQRARAGLAEPLLYMRRFISRNNGSIVCQFKQMVVLCTRLVRKLCCSHPPCHATAFSFKHVSAGTLFSSAAQFCFADIRRRDEKSCCRYHFSAGSPTRSAASGCATCWAGADHLQVSRSIRP